LWNVGPVVVVGHDGSSSPGASGRPPELDPGVGTPPDEDDAPPPFVESSQAARRAKRTTAGHAKREAIFMTVTLALPRRARS
jgi:hypothetical protein